MLITVKVLGGAEHTLDASEIFCDLYLYPCSKVCSLINVDNTGSTGHSSDTGKTGSC